MKTIWSSQYELGIEVIDNQHKRIVEYINQIHELSHSNSGDVSEVLHNLVDYTYSHFAFEEALMEEAGYPALTEHQFTHRTFIKQIETLKQRFNQGEQVAQELAAMLQHWLLNHIQEDDSSYSSLVKSNILGEHAERHQNWVKKAFQQYFKSPG